MIVTEQYPKGLGSTVAELGLENYPDIKPVAKTQFSMLTKDVLDTLKTDFPLVRTLVICGIEAHVCVQGTALQAIEKGF